ncbi:MAG: hypothetical protein JXQ73_18785 [Phycisphaerae bacterium]|nr:hypothetical protein [Phycisphaerae bacterium]
MLIPALNWKSLWKKRGFRAAVVGLSSLFVLSGVGTAGYYLWPEPAPKPPPPVQTATTQEARQYLASEDFSRLPIEQRIEWMDQARKKMDQMGEEERRKVWENTDEKTREKIGENMREMFRARMDHDVKTFITLPESEREAFLDKKIDEMQQFRGRGGPPGMGRGPRGDRGGRPPDGEARGGSGDRGQRPEGARGGDRGRRRGGGGPGSWMARMPADKRAEFNVYRKAMGKRMAERGISFGGRGR